MCCMLWRGVVKDDDTALNCKVLQYSEGDFPACKCYQAINKGGERVLREDCMLDGGMRPQGNYRP